MDNVTHALAGLLIADGVVATQQARGRALPDAARATITIAGVLTAELPDVDLAWSGLARGPEALAYLLHHRGHTHTVVVAVAAAFLVWGVLLALRHPLRESSASRALLATCLLGTLSHIVLDWTNSYGVHPFWPFANAWHYGDAVFIVEPWFWVLAIPAVLVGQRTRITRVLLGGLLFAILALAWLGGNASAATAATLTVAAGVAGMVARRTTAPTRLALAIGAWLVVEGVFFAGSRAAETALRAALPVPPDDIVLTPGAADPLCWSALAVWEDGTTYRVRGAVVRPAPRLRAANACRMAAQRGLEPITTPGTAAVQWTGESRAPAGELAALARADCRLAAALRFMRVPAWRRGATGTALWDLRYGEGSFASITSDGRGACPDGVPPWEPPRGRLLGAAP